MSVCSIWGTPATLSYSQGNGWDVDSPRAGGKYFVSTTAGTEIQKLTDFEKARLTTWILDQNRAGLVPKITLDNFREVLSSPRLPVFERADRLLQYIAAEVEGLGDTFELLSTADHKLSPKYLRALAWTESATDKEFLFVANYLEHKEWGKVGPMSAGHRGTTWIKFDGYRRLEELAQVNRNSVQAFVAMWFDEEMNSTFEDGIKPAIESVGYKPFRIDRKDHNNKIDDEIIAEIKRSRFLVADFTCKVSISGDGPISEARGGVYYEAGFAQGLGIPVIWTCRKDMVKYLHFDTRQFNHIIWEKPEDLLAQLKNRIGAVIGYGPLKAN